MISESYAAVVNQWLVCDNGEHVLEDIITHWIQLLFDGGACELANIRCTIFTLKTVGRWLDDFLCCQWSLVNVHESCGLKILDKLLWNLSITKMRITFPFQQQGWLFRMTIYTPSASESVPCLSTVFKDVMSCDFNNVIQTVHNIVQGINSWFSSSFHETWPFLNHLKVATKQGF